MARLREIEDNQSALYTNPWEEELRERDEKEEEEAKNDEEVEEEQEQQFQARQQILLPNRSISIPETRIQKGLALIFGKVDRQIELLDKQVNAIQVELLQARDLVMAVKSTVANLNKPEASELLERDVFTNYLRIIDRLKAIANNIGMIMPDHGHQIVRARKTYDKGFVYSDSDPGESDPELINAEWTTYEFDDSGLYEESGFSESTYEEPNSDEPSVRWSSAYASDEFISLPSRRQQPTRQRLPKRPRYTRQPPPVIYNRRREPMWRNRHTAHFAPTFRISSTSSSSATSGSLVYTLTDSSNMEDWPRERYSRRYPHYTQRRGGLRATSAARRRRRPLSIRPEANVTESGDILVREESQMPSEEPRVLFTEPKDAQVLSVEAILHEQQAFLLEKLYEVQGRLKAAQSRPVVNSSAGDGDEVQGSILKGNFWTRLKSKIHRPQQESKINMM
jgi:hypothetical protein